FSQTYKKGFGLWTDDFDSMAQKTVIKLLLSKYAPLSVEIQTAVITDLSVVKNSETLDAEYVDNSEPDVDKEEERIKAMLQDCTSIIEVDDLQVKNPDIDIELFKTRKEELKNGR